MEDYQKVIIVGAGLNDMNPSGPPYHLFTEAVLIDKRHPHGIYPTLYQVSQAPLSEALVYPSVDHFLSLQNNAFVLMGEVLHLDRREKVIHLADGHTVSYNYLIVLNGSPEGSGRTDLAEYTPGVQALMDAIKLHSRFQVAIQPFISGRPSQALPADQVRVGLANANISQLASTSMQDSTPLSAHRQSHRWDRDTRLFLVET